MTKKARLTFRTGKAKVQKKGLRQIVKLVQDQERLSYMTNMHKA